MIERLDTHKMSAFIDKLNEVIDCINEKEPKKVSAIPHLLDIIDYCKERNNSVDPEAFHDFYSAKGWMIGKNKMKDWKAAIRTWEDSGEKVVSNATSIYKVF